MTYVKSPYTKKYIRLFASPIGLAEGNVVKFVHVYRSVDAYKFIRFYFSRPKEFWNLSARIKKDKEALFKKYNKKFDPKDLRRLRSDKLIGIYNEMLYLLKCLFYVNQVVWQFDIGGSKFLKDELQNKGHKSGVAYILTQPTRKNYLEDEKIEFWKLCLKYFKNKNRTTLNHLLENHLEKFAYVGVSYYNEPSKKKDDYVKQIKKFLTEGKHWQYFRRIINQERREFRDKLKLRDKIYNKIRDSYLRNAILILREAVYLKDYFRGSVSEIRYHYFDALLKELACRLKIKDDEIKTLTYDELEKLLYGKKINWKDIKKRQGFFATGVINHKFFLVYGKKAKLIEKKYFRQRGKEKTKELKGISVKKGIVRGWAKIVLTYDDFKKFKDDDILVTVNTMPEFMPIIRKARAIVTELGGITCHAAIISRELNKPCIIGVSKATKILKDGDLIEIDADRGIVKILKRAG